VLDVKAIEADDCPTITLPDIFGLVTVPVADSPKLAVAFAILIAESLLSNG
jgi:hypothetical protein